MGVSRYKLKDSKGKELFSTEPGSCFAAFITNSGYYQPHKGVAAQAATMDIQVTADITPSFARSKLIQALAPGLIRHSDRHMTIPLVDVPFDQIICALRLLKYESLLGILVDTYLENLVSDSKPCAFGFTMEDFREYYKAFESKWAKDSYTGYNLVTSGGFMNFLKKKYGAHPYYLSLSSYPRLISGDITKGVLPAYTEGLGYAKYYSLLTDQMDRSKKTYKIQGGQPGSDLGVYYDGAYISINHPIIVPDLELAKELQDKFGDNYNYTSTQLKIKAYLVEKFGE